MINKDNIYIFGFSANTEESLFLVVKQMVKWIREHNNEFTLSDLSYTLLVRKVQYSVCIAFLSDNVDDLCHQMENYLSSGRKDLLFDMDNNSVSKRKMESVILNNDDALAPEIDRFDLLSYLCFEYSSGKKYDWKNLFFEMNVTCLSLPNYPYMKSRFWIYDRNENYRKKHQEQIKKNDIIKVFYADKNILNEHIINYKKTYPAMAYINDVKRMLENEYNCGSVELRNIFYLNPFVDNDSGKMLFKYHKNDEIISYEISSLCDGSKVVNVKGEAVLDNTLKKALFFENEEWKKNCNSLMEKETCYSAFTNGGIEYGESFRSVCFIYFNDKKSYSKISLCSQIDKSLHDTAIMDCAIQTILALNNSNRKDIFIPFEIKKIEFYNDIPHECMSYVEKIKDQEYTVVLTDLKGKICVVINGLILRKISEKNNKRAEYVFANINYEECEICHCQKKADYLFFIGRNKDALIYDGISDGMSVISKLESLSEKIESKTKENDESFKNAEIINIMIDADSVVNDIKRYTENFLDIVSALKLIKKTVKKKVHIIAKADLIDFKAVMFVKALWAFAKTYSAEASEFYYTGIVTDDVSRKKCFVALPLEIRLIEESRVKLIAYNNNKRFISVLSIARAIDKADASFGKDGGVYVIGGGNGKIGKYISSYFLNTYNCRVVGIGRHDLEGDEYNDIVKSKHELSSYEYITADLSDTEQVHTAIEKIHNEYGNITGIVNCVGVVRDALLINKSDTDIKEVVDSKYLSTLYLDEETKNDNLDFYVLFSSIASKVGNVGQSDYAFANGLINEYAGFRNIMCTEGKRSGSTLAINWPYWQDGGMQINLKQVEELEKYLGTKPIMFEDAVAVINEGLSFGQSDMMVLKGKKSVVQNCLQELNSIENSKNNATTNICETDNYNELHKYIMKVFSEEVGLSEEVLNPYEPFESYGIDSTLIVSIIERLEEKFPNLNKTAMFENGTIYEFEQYLLKKYYNEIQEFASANEIKNIGLEIEASEKYSVDDIAIIGISGMYPKADDLGEFWENLIAGKDCISEIPINRWDHSKYLNDDTLIYNPLYSKWGGFIKNVYGFDPLFFHISPHEAELMDPQERLMLETIWHTMEDAAYTRKKLEKSKVGVYIGVMYNHYQLLGVEAQHKGEMVSPAPSSASIANRISYFFNLKGPSMTVDTMCSSSLTAIHLACESLKRGETELAFAGGVNLILHPSKYIMLDSNKFSSSDGKCKSFGEGGDGYVSGEGVGAILLKPLGSALKDNDRIYAVIKSSAVNHGGKTNGYSVPSPIAQKNVIQEAMRKANIKSDKITYVEAHGTGTALGDPIEIAGLCDAFNSDKKQYCSIGSVKSNIGHAESASGVAALTKVILQMKNNMLVPSLHSDEINREIDFESSPFKIQRKAEEWSDKKDVKYAGISCFGAGGSNAHLIIESWNTSELEDDFEFIPVLLFSAKTQEQLKKYVKSNYELLCNNENIDFKRAVYTLQIGREAMEHRVAFYADSKENALSFMRKYLSGIDDAQHIFTNSLTYGEILKKKHNGYVDIERMNITEVIQRWSSGDDVNWEGFYNGKNIIPIQMSEYPFSKEEYRIYHFEERKTEKIPFIFNENISDFYSQKYHTTLNNRSAFLDQHIVNNSRLLAGAMIIEMMLECSIDACKKEINTLENVIFNHPIDISDEKTDLYISLENKDKIYVKVENKNGMCCSSGELGTDSVDMKKALIFDENIISECNDKFIGKDECYEIFKKCGIEYGINYQVINSIRCGHGKCVANIKLNELTEDTMKMTEVAPLLIDGCFQAVIGSKISDRVDIDSYSVPYLIEKMYLYKKPSGECSVYVIEKEKSPGSSTFDINVWNDKKESVLTILGLKVANIQKQSDVVSNSCIITSQIMQKRDLELNNIKEIKEKNVIVIYNNIEFSRAIDDEFSDKTVYLIPEKEFFDDALELLDVVSEDTILIYEKKTSSSDAQNEIKTLASLLKKCINNHNHIYFKIIIIGDNKVDEKMNAISGVLKCAVLECSRLSAKCISFEGMSWNRIGKYIKSEICQDFQVKCVHYNREVRYVEEMSKVDIIDECKNFLSDIIKSDGVYLITGGLGRIGFCLAEEFAKKGNIKLILVGRSELDDVRRKKIEKLQRLNSTTEYYIADISNENDVEGMIANIKKKYHMINGIIHTAGVLDDSLICNISDDKIRNVLKPKVIGAYNLDKTTSDEKMDFFIVCSSLSAITGNYGQGVYAYANGKLLDFVYERNERLKDKNCFGRSIAINWPLWKDSKITDDSRLIERIYNETGMRILDSDMAISAFNEIVKRDLVNAGVIYGEIGKIFKSLKIK